MLTRLLLGLGWNAGNFNIWDNMAYLVFKHAGEYPIHSLPLASCSNSIQHTHLELCREMRLKHACHSTDRDCIIPFPPFLCVHTWKPLRVSYPCLVTIPRVMAKCSGKSSHNVSCDVSGSYKSHVYTHSQERCGRERSMNWLILSMPLSTSVLNCADLVYGCGESIHQ